MQSCDSLATVIGVVASLSAYQYKSMWLPVQPAVKFDVPVYFSSVELSQLALFAFDEIPDEYDGEIKANIDKKLSNKLHVCVCVCVGFCGFQPIVLFSLSFLSCFLLSFIYSYTGDYSYPYSSIFYFL